MQRIAIMQGRLSPPEDGRFQSFPRNSWREEFERAATAGLDAIEWIYDAYSEGANPIETDAGVAEMRDLSESYGIAVKSVCADYFMDFPFLRTSQDEELRLVGKLFWLLEQCSRLGIERVVIPFVDRSRIWNEREVDQVIEIMEKVIPAAEAAHVELHLETDLAPAPFAKLLERLPHASIKANYDSGNSASHGYFVSEEFAAYGNRIGSVHIKDRILGGGTVPLGTGNADLPAVFRELAQSGYAGDYVLQVARGNLGDEVAWATKNCEMLLDYLGAAGISLVGANP